LLRFILCFLKTISNDKVSNEERRINGSIKERYRCCPTGEIIIAYKIIAEANNIDVAKNLFVTACFISGLSMARAPSISASIFKNKEIIQTGFSLMSRRPFFKFPFNKFFTASMSDFSMLLCFIPKFSSIVSTVVSCQNNLGI